VFGSYLFNNELINGNGIKFMSFFLFSPSIIVLLFSQAGQLRQLAQFWPQLEFLSAAKGAPLDPRLSTNARAKAVSRELVCAAGGEWTTKHELGSRQRSAQRRPPKSSSGSKGENGWLGSPKGASEKDDENNGGIRRRK